MRNEKNMLFICIFPHFLLRSKDSLAIVPNGPDFFPSLFRTKGSQPAPGQLGKKRKRNEKIRRISRLDGSQAFEQNEDRFTHGRESRHIKKDRSTIL
jgi:hypothetical protein